MIYDTATLNAGFTTTRMIFQDCEHDFSLFVSLPMQCVGLWEYTTVAM